VTLATPPFQKIVTRCVWTVTGNVQVKNEVHSSNATDRMCHNIRGVKLTPASHRRYKIGLPVEGLMRIYGSNRSLQHCFPIDDTLCVRFHDQVEKSSEITLKI